MTENNTTIEECITDCIEAASSSIFDDIEIVLVAVVALLGIGAWAYKKYQALNADGKITLDEIIDSIDEVKEKAEEAKEEIEKIEKTLDSHNVAELKEMLKEAGLSVKGKKADLVARLEAHMGEA
jgi:hypothetical protein